MTKCPGEFVFNTTLSAYLCVPKDDDKSESDIGLILGLSLGIGVPCSLFVAWCMVWPCIRTCQRDAQKRRQRKAALEAQQAAPRPPWALPSRATEPFLMQGGLLRRAADVLAFRSPRWAVPRDVLEYLDDHAPSVVANIDGQLPTLTLRTDADAAEAAQGQDTEVVRLDRQAQAVHALLVLEAAHKDEYVGTTFLRWHHALEEAVGSGGQPGRDDPGVWDLTLRKHARAVLDRVQGMVSLV